MKSGEEWYNKVYESPRLPQRAVLKPNLYHGRQDPFFLKREHPSTIKAKKAKSTGTPVAIATATEELKSSEKPAAVTWTSEDKVYHTQLFKNRMTFAKSRVADGRLRQETKTSNRSARLRRNTSAAWETLSILRCARSLLKYNAKIACYIGKLALYLVFAVHACDLHKRIASWTEIDLMSGQSRVV